MKSSSDTTRPSQTSAWLLGTLIWLIKTDPESELLKPIKALIHFRMAGIYGVLGVPDEALDNYKKGCALDKQLDGTVCQSPEGR